MSADFPPAGRGERMASALCFREFINERLSAAAEEICRLFEQTVYEYQEEISRQRSLLDSVLKPEAVLQKKEILKLSAHNEEVPADQQDLCNQDGVSGLDLNDLEVSQIKEEEEEELWTSLSEEQHPRRPGTEFAKLHLTQKGRIHSSDVPLLMESQESDDDEDDGEEEDEDEEDMSPSKLSVVVVKSESDREDAGLSEAHRDLSLNQEGLSTNQKREKKLVKCSFCPKRVSDFMKLKIHVRTHTGEKPFQCDTCGKSFTKKPLLKKHMITHTGLKPFICGVCGKKFNYSSNRDTHMKTHSTEKPFTCDICGKAFRRSADLKRHSRCHTGEKPYSCNFCGQVFPYHTSLKNHLRRHTGEKPYRCMWCGKGFALKATMTIHTRVHTGEKPYQCGGCGNMYAHKTGLNEHKKLCHMWQKQKI